MNKLFIIAAIIAVFAFVTANAYTLRNLEHALAIYEEEEDSYALQGNPEFYIVQSGDYLGKIANMFGCSVGQLVSLNNIQNANLIYVGQRIRLCNSSPAPGPAPGPAPQPGWRTPDGPHNMWWKQCGNNFSGTPIGSSNICNIGCLLTSLTVAHRQHGIPLNGSFDYDPGHMARWFSSHGGFQGDLLVHGTVTKISGNSQYLGQKQASYAAIKQHLDNGESVIANVNRGGHWVLVYGYNPADQGNFLVRDSGAGRGTFHISEMGVIAVYRLRR